MCPAPPPRASLKAVHGWGQVQCSNFFSLWRSFEEGKRSSEQFLGPWPTNAELPSSLQRVYCQRVLSQVPVFLFIQLMSRQLVLKYIPGLLTQRLMVQILFPNPRSLPRTCLQVLTSNPSWICLHLDTTSSWIRHHPRSSHPGRLIHGARNRGRSASMASCCGVLVNGSYECWKSLVCAAGPVSYSARFSRPAKSPSAFWMPATGSAVPARQVANATAYVAIIATWSSTRWLSRHQQGN